ncbi:hypothetical protein [Kineococcus sp. SYSU DK005]|uniref:hypothetical protein n=1 Tax=Kineococcus sp. SYSU DK005 TaxID=3383126 RepID=UPI003D7C95AE
MSPSSELSARLLAHSYHRAFCAVRAQLQHLLPQLRLQEPDWLALVHATAQLQAQVCWPAPGARLCVQAQHPEQHLPQLLALIEQHPSWLLQIQEPTAAAFTSLGTGTVPLPLHAAQLADVLPLLLRRQVRAQRVCTWPQTTRAALYFWDLDSCDLQECCGGVDGFHVELHHDQRALRPPQTRAEATAGVEAAPVPGPLEHPGTAPRDGLPGGSCGGPGGVGDDTELRGEQRVGQRAWEAIRTALPLGRVVAATITGTGTGTAAGTAAGAGAGAGAGASGATASTSGTSEPDGRAEVFAEIEGYPGVVAVLSTGTRTDHAGAPRVARRTAHRAGSSTTSDGGPSSSAAPGTRIQARVVRHRRERRQVELQLTRVLTGPRPAAPGPPARDARSTEHRPAATVTAPRTVSGWICSCSRCRS